MRGAATAELSTMIADYGADDATPGSDGADTDLGMIRFSGRQSRTLHS